MVHPLNIANTVVRARVSAAFFHQYWPGYTTRCFRGKRSAHQIGEPWTKRPRGDDPWRGDDQARAGRQTTKGDRLSHLNGLFFFGHHYGDFRGDIFMQAHGDLELSQLFDGFVQNDLAAVDDVVLSGQCVGHILGGDGAE